ncbi:MAG: GIY-YIG nuclease family protein [Cyanobacteria bacterium J06633_8]
MGKVGIARVTLSKVLANYLLPLVCAVYFVLHDNKVVYVGKATVLRQRWDSHHRIKEFKNLPGEVRIAWHKSDSPELIDELEKSMIACFKPSMNGSKG